MKTLTMKLLLSTFLIACLGISISGIVHAQDSPPRSGDWTLTFEDNFEGDELDTLKWSTPGHGDNQFRSLDFITVEDGVARVNLYERDEPYIGGEPDFAEYHWNAGRLSTEDTWTFSPPFYVEVRGKRAEEMDGFTNGILQVRGPDGRGGTFNNWAHGTWHDIISDFNNEDGSCGAWHASYGPDDVGLNDGTPAEWNTYGVDIDADGVVTWYINGEAFHTADADCKVPEDAVFWMTQGMGIDDPDTTHVYQDYDFVRIWQEDYDGPVWEPPTSSEVVNSLPTRIELEQNYPNPFNPGTNINYHLPEASEVRLEVYDMLGRRVAILVDGRVSAGQHTVHFDGSNLSSGVYIYRLTVGDQVISRQLTLMK